MTTEILNKVSEKIIRQTLSAMKSEGKKYNGCLYAGLMINNGEASVVEFNCRFGDPETQVVLPIIDGDFLELLYSAATGSINKNSIFYNNRFAITLVTASEGYPSNYEKGFAIDGIKDAENENTIVFHAGTKKSNGKLTTNGGRVLNVTGISDRNLKNAKNIAYEALGKINYSGKVYRTDIGFKAFKKN
jgi:phosphoribosylamine--glycine ligase